MSDQKKRPMKPDSLSDRVHRGQIQAANHEHDMRANTVKCRLTGRGERNGSDPGVGAPTSEVLPDGQLADHWVLCPDERAKGFVRPVRDRYKHVGIPGPKHPLRDLTPEEHEGYDKYGYVKYEEFPEPVGAVVGRCWTQAQIDSIGKGCGVVTSMPHAIAETYARDPEFYGSTFCCGCGKYLQVGEFIWLDGSRVGS